VHVVPQVRRLPLAMKAESQMPKVLAMVNQMVTQKVRLGLMVRA
jgi:hypothetical protein